MSTNFGLKDGVLVRFMTLEDYENVKDFLGEHFYNAEPLCVATGVDCRPPFEQIFGDYHIWLIEQGTCLIALDTNDAERIVGVVLAGPGVESHLEEGRMKAEKLAAGRLRDIYTFQTDVECKGNVFKHYGVSEILYSHVTTVDTAKRGKGIGTRLAAALMEVGRLKGYPLMSATCSSFYSARQKLAMGMECIYAEAYADHKYANGEVVIQPAAPHTHIRVLAIKL
ncbi:hypothetical protein KR093_011162 [Drosophila rubida]|uniref:aralkylamine N-acetyltransferase n=1 Tax=Drosophila rubida TaxID=30044 RepID=A0AAD4K6H0_9MUSC|nr:hypothetical protein KR093_011162 [Drosophila rubida]